MLMAQSLGQARRNSVTSFQNYSIVIIIISLGWGHEDENDNIRLHGVKVLDWFLYFYTFIYFYFISLFTGLSQTCWRKWWFFVTDKQNLPIIYRYEYMKYTNYKELIEQLNWMLVCFDSTAWNQYYSIVLSILSWYCTCPEHPFYNSWPELFWETSVLKLTLL